MITKTLHFLAELQANNHKAWFDAHRHEWNEIRRWFQQLVEELIEGISEFDPAVRGLKVSDCTYRINRDIRFSPDKSPYKTWLGAYICPKGKCSGYAGYYFHIEPKGGARDWGHMLVSGLYMPEGAILQSLRDEIFDNGAEIKEAIREAEGFVLNEENRLKRNPKGFPAGCSDYEEWLRQKDFMIEKHLDEKWLLQPDLGRRVVQEFRKTYHFNEILNRAVTFAYEEMM